MRPVAEAFLRSGMIPDETVAEFRRWGVLPKNTSLEPFESADEAVEAIRDALESEAQVRVQKTDLDLLRHYLDPSNQRKGRLVVVDETTKERMTKTITFARFDNYVLAVTRERYVIPWIAESIKELIANGVTYLSYDDNGTNRCVRFIDMEEMYFGDMKTFMVCEPMLEDPQ